MTSNIFTDLNSINDLRQAQARDQHRIDYLETMLAESDSAYSSLMSALAAVDLQQTRREELAAILETIAADGFPHPRHLDAALDAIYTLLLGN